MTVLSPLDRVADAPPRCRGQSTTEFVVLALVLTPLFLAVPLLGKYLDVSQHAAEASRYAAFEITVRGPVTSKDEATVVAEARRRLMGATTAPIKTGDVAGDFAGFRNPLWTDFRSAPMIDNFEQQVTHEAPRESHNAVPAALAGGSGFRLPRDNFYTARIGVTPNKPNNFFTPQWNDVNLQMNRQTAILIDAWNAASATVVRSRIENAGVAVYPIDLLKLEANTMGRLPSDLMGEPAMRVGEHDPDIVPCDRLDPPC